MVTQFRRGFIAVSRLYSWIRQSSSRSGRTKFIKMFVTHQIFSKQTSKLDDVYVTHEHICCLNSRSESGGLQFMRCYHEVNFITNICFYLYSEIVYYYFWVHLLILLFPPLIAYSRRLHRHSVSILCPWFTWVFIQIRLVEISNAYPFYLWWGWIEEEWLVSINFNFNQTLILYASVTSLCYHVWKIYKMNDGIMLVAKSGSITFHRFERDPKIWYRSD